MAKQKRQLPRRSWARPSWASPSSMREVKAELDAYWFNEGYECSLFEAKYRTQRELEVLEPRLRRAFNRGFELGSQQSLPSFDDARSLWFELLSGREVEACPS